MAETTKRSQADTAADTAANTAAKAAPAGFDALFGGANPIEAPRPKRKRRALAVAAVATLATAGVLLYTQLGAADKPQVSYRTTPVQQGDVTKKVTATGTVSPLVTVSVGAQVSGRIKALYADFNSAVKKGQVIARIDPRLLAAEVAKAKANVSAARARVVQAQSAAREAKLQYDRDRKLAAKNVVAAAEVQTRRSAYRSASAAVTAARATVSQAKATLALAKTNLDYTTIVSPIDGVVVSRNVDVGQTVAASLSAPTLFTIAEDLTKMEVHTSVAESDVGQIKEGLRVEFTVDAFPKRTFRGVVKQVRYAAQTVQNVVTYDAVVSVSNKRLELRPGMTATATFVVAERKNVLRVASAALRFRPPRSGQSPARKRPARARKAKAANAARKTRSIFVLRQGQLQRVKLTVGLSDGTNTELSGPGLAAGDLAVVGINAATAGKKVAAKQRSGGRGRRGRIF